MEEKLPTITDIKLAGAEGDQICHAMQLRYEGMTATQKKIFKEILFGCNTLKTEISKPLWVKCSVIFPDCWLAIYMTHHTLVKYFIWYLRNEEKNEDS